MEDSNLKCLETSAKACAEYEQFSPQEAFSGVYGFQLSRACYGLRVLFTEDANHRNMNNKKQIMKVIELLGSAIDARNY